MKDVLQALLTNPTLLLLLICFVLAMGIALRLAGPVVIRSKRWDICIGAARVQADPGMHLPVPPLAPEKKRSTTGRRTGNPRSEKRRVNKTLV